MPTGKVKWFNNAKGYGFILPEEGGEDLFVHYSSIQMEGYKTLKAGQVVEYETLKSAKGFHRRPGPSRGSSGGSSTATTSTVWPRSRGWRR